MRPTRERVARLLLLGFEATEADDIIRDLNELSVGRGPIKGKLYFWTALARYPVQRAWDRLRHLELHSAGTNGGGGTMGSIVGDLRYAARTLARNMSFTATATALLALSMGAAISIFSIVKGVILDPLPVDRPDRLVSVWLGADASSPARMTPGNFLDIAAGDELFSSVAAFSGQTTSLTSDGDPIFLRGGSVTPPYFETLGVELLQGRPFTAEEGERGGPAVVILSHHVWQQQFGGDPGVVGKAVIFDGSPFDVIGVAPPGVYPTHATVSGELPFSSSNHDFFVPLRYGPEGWANRRSHVLGMIARLDHNVEMAAASAGMEALSAGLHEQGMLNPRERIFLTSFTEEVVGDVRFALLTLLGTVGLLLLIAVVNVGALFVLRADDRQREISVREALGASKVRILSPLFWESILTVSLSSIGAVFIARSILSGLQTLMPYQIPRLSEVQVDGAAFLVTLALGAVIAATFGIGPALEVGGRRRAHAVGRRGQTPGFRQRRLQTNVVAVQACLAVVVLVGGVLLSRSYYALRSTDAGFESTETWAMTIPTDVEILEEIVRDVRELPGVAAAAIAYDHPLERNWGDSFLIEGVPVQEGERPPMASLRPFGDGYFGTTGVRATEGRIPDALDLAGPVGYAVVNESLRETFFPDRPVIGARIVLPTSQRIFGGEGVFEVVAVVQNVRFLGPDQPASPALYVPLSHFPVTASTLLVRPNAPNAEIMAGVRQVVRRADSGLAIQRGARLSDLLDDLLARPRFNMMLLGSFGVLGLLLCGLGAYGLVSRVVVMRSREIGIRMALGEKNSRLARTVIASALRPMVVGGAVGVGLSFVLGRVMESLLFEISSADLVSFVAGPTFVLVIGAIAASVPTLRAISIDPASALRSD